MYQKVAFCIKPERINELKMDVHITVVRSVILNNLFWTLIHGLNKSFVKPMFVSILLSFIVYATRCIDKEPKDIRDLNPTLGIT